MISIEELKALNERTVYVGDPDAYPLDEEMRELLWEESAPLQEVFATEFQRYLDLFYKFSPKKSVHIRTFYGGGFVCPKRRLKSGLQIDQSCYPDMIARHLDLERWQHNHPSVGYPECYWVAMREPRKSSLKAIDVDNKENVLGYYCKRDGQRMIHRPLPILTVEHLQAVKRIYDAFPNHIWCVSSATLGLHIWQRYVRPLPLIEIDASNRPILARIGLGNTEIHPMVGRAFRRPFGQDYFTLTPDGPLDDWRKQLDYLEHDARTPPFEVVFQSLRSLLVDEWGEYQASFEGKQLRPSSKHPELVRQFFRGNRWLPSTLDYQLEELDRWARDGFKTHSTFDGSKPTHSSKRCSQSGSAGIWTYKFNGDWVQQCREWAIHGLPAEDSMTFVVLHLARWFLHIEFFDAEDRFEQTCEVLEHFCQTKNNGFISRLNQGLVHEVLQHVRRLVTVANKPLAQDKAKVFEDIRRKRADGSYKTNYYLEPVILCPVEDTEVSTFSSSVLFTVCSTLSESHDQDETLTLKELRQQEAKTWNPVLDERPLPDALNAKILSYYARKGIRIKKPTIAAITRFLRHISAIPDGRRLSQKALKKFGFSNDRTRRHIRHLELIGLISIVPACPAAGASNRFRLTELGRDLLEGATVTDN